MKVFCSQVGNNGVTFYIYELAELASRYRDRIHSAIRVEYPKSHEQNHYYYTYGLVVKPVADGLPYWIPYCARNTTNFSGEGGRGHLRIEEQLKNLGIHLHSTTAAINENDEDALIKGWEELIKLTTSA
ncbi:hypothetical protein [Desulfofundulus thermocisternus]|uniref:hypothetical protein n=1 Tax=Desulfofundulus thermocisternus TaxID=42471 RepID=UPI00217DE746|nr:hypothetical protein [Desulfofundulus thermocisternus]MCS5696950.1 hypothetical protein [Desulfofundulus thermocisternus]